MPYVLALCSHKGGTGRTTAALAFAWLWGQAGRRITLIDADPTGAAGLVAVDRSGTCPWPNVRFVAQPTPPRRVAECGGDGVIVDCPPLGTPTTQEVLNQANGVILTGVAESLALRTLPVATAAIEAAHTLNPGLNFLGILLGLFQNEDGLQAPLLAELCASPDSLLLGLPIPYDAALRDWALTPGADLPVGPGHRALATVAQLVGACLDRPRPSNRLAPQNSR